MRFVIHDFKDVLFSVMMNGNVQHLVPDRTEFVVDTEYVGFLELGNSDTNIRITIAGDGFDIATSWACMT
jgi:hypothetical protein